MKKIYCQLALSLGLSMIVNSGTQVFAQSADINIKITSPTPPSPTQDDNSCPDEESPQASQSTDEESPQASQSTDEKNRQASQSIRLYYLRSAETIKGILDKVADANPCIKGTVIEAQGDSEIILYGKQKQRKELQRTIAILDLPRESVSMDMWGIRISSDNPEQLAEAMREVNQEIDETQRLLQYTYKRLEDFARKIRIEQNTKGQNTKEQKFKDLFENTLGYQTALDNNKPSLSMIDILLRTNVAQDPIKNYNSAAGKLCTLFRKKEYIPYIASAFPEYLSSKANAFPEYRSIIESEFPEYRSIIESDEEAIKENPKERPFENYFRIGLHQEQLNSDTNLFSNCKEENDDKKDRILTKEEPEKEVEKCFKNSKKEKEKEVCLENLRIRGAVLDFALQYSRLKEEADRFNPDSLQQSADNLESILHPIIDAINRDVKELFIEPTLTKIQDIVREYDDVEYAEVGKTTVAGLNGVPSTVSSTSVSAFDETPPLRLNELLDSAGISADALLPDAATNTIPAASVAKLIAALGEDRSLWQELTSGVTLNITPSVLRNSASAELEVDLTTGPGEGGTREEGVRPLSRISQNHVKTSVYVDTLDIFALSTFNSQTTIDGGRTYIPIVGTIWEGVFSGIPVFGDLFSWQNAPKNVQHQSIVLTNSFIVPTAMGLAPLYSTNREDEYEYEFEYLSSEVKKYKSDRRKEINKL